MPLGSENAIIRRHIAKEIAQERQFLEAAFDREVIVRWNAVDTYGEDFCSQLLKPGIVPLHEREFTFSNWCPI